MILGTVGTHHQGFDRLVRALDELAAGIAEPVVIQRGAATYMPKHAAHFDWTSGPDMERLINEARVVVSQAGAGSILTILKYRKPLVVVPRLRVHAEVFDDHQLELAHALHTQHQAVAVADPSAAALAEAIAQAVLLTPPTGQSDRLVAALRQRLETWTALPRRSMR